MVTDLTNTTWVFHDVLTSDDRLQSQGFEFTIGNVDFSQFSISQQGSTTTDIIYGKINGTEITTTNVYSFTTNTWVNDDYKTIYISGGINTTDTDFISWLYDNAELQSDYVSEFNHNGMDYAIYDKRISEEVPVDNQVLVWNGEKYVSKDIFTVDESNNELIINI